MACSAAAQLREDVCDARLRDTRRGARPRRRGEISFAAGATAAAPPPRPPATPWPARPRRTARARILFVRRSERLLRGVVSSRLVYLSREFFFCEVSLSVRETSQKWREILVENATDISV